MKKIPIELSFALVMLGALFTWAFYHLVYDTLGLALLKVGVVDGIYQNLIIVIIAGAILIYKGKDLKKLLGK